MFQEPNAVCMTMCFTAFQNNKTHLAEKDLEKKSFICTLVFSSLQYGYCISAKTCKQRIGTVVLFLQLLVQENLENLTDDAM